MSVVLGYACGEYSILLCDKRGINTNGDICDNNEKLCVIPNKGWVSAIGHAGLAEVTFKEIRSNKINGFIDVLNIYQRMFDIAIKGNVIQHNNGSMLILNMINDHDNLDKFVLFTIGESNNGLIPLAYENKIIMNGPSDDVYFKISGKYSYGQDVSGSPNHIIHVMQAIFQDISKASEYVSKQFDIGAAIKDQGKISIGKISNHEPLEDPNYDWMSEVDWI